MDLLPKSHSEFSQKEYWDSFFKKRGNKAFEWYGEYPELSGHLHKYIKRKDDILITGCGNSTLGRDLYDIGHSKITNIDISQVVIRQMQSQNEKERPGLKYLVMDALNTTFESEQFSVILDKGTLDALMPDSDPETLAKIDSYFREITRTLRNGGRYICISLLQEHILKGLLEYFPRNNYMFRAVRCFEAEAKAAENNENPMPTFVIVCTKFNALPRLILELNLSSQDKMQRCDSVADIIDQVSACQNAAFICSGLRRATLDSDSEVSLDLYKQGDSRPRFTVYVIDSDSSTKGRTQYSAFIVPQGREAEWLFSTKSGRLHLSKMTNSKRLALITMHRGQSYGDFSQVQSELGHAIVNLAPATLKDEKIEFMSLGSDVGNRVVKYEGHSKFSGDYVVEDVIIDNVKFRRLFYMGSQLVIQSEARFRRNRNKKETIDLTHLTCKHHMYMSVATRLATQSGGGELVVLGLGGGGLCSFLRRFLVQQVKITGVDIDPEMLNVATKWFGLTLGDNMDVVIKDGLDFLREMSLGDQKYSAILFDVDSKDSSIGMSCPPKQFVEKETLNHVSKLLGKDGFFVLNLVVRDSSIRSPVLETLKSNFATVVSYRLAEDLNEILVCTNGHKDVKDKLVNAAKDFNKFTKRSDLDVTEYRDGLKLL